MAVLPGLAAVAAALLRPTTPAVTARLLDRELGLSATVATALELERSGAAAGGLGALAVADGRRALSASLGGGVARLHPEPWTAGIAAVAAAALVALAVVPGTGGTAARSGAGRSSSGGNTHAASAGAGQTPGPSLTGFKATPLHVAKITRLGTGQSAHDPTTGAGTSIYGHGAITKAGVHSQGPVSTSTLGSGATLKQTGGNAVSGGGGASESTGQGAGSLGSNGADEATSGEGVQAWLRSPPPTAAADRHRPRQGEASHRAPRRPAMSPATRRAAAVSPSPGPRPRRPA